MSYNAKDTRNSPQLLHDQVLTKSNKETNTEMLQNILAFCRPTQTHRKPTTQPSELLQRKQTS